MNAENLPKKSGNGICIMFPTTLCDALPWEVREQIAHLVLGSRTMTEPSPQCPPMNTTTHVFNVPIQLNSLSISECLHQIQLVISQVQNLKLTLFQDNPSELQKQLCFTLSLSPRTHDALAIHHQNWDRAVHIEPPAPVNEQWTSEELASWNIQMVSQYGSGIPAWNLALVKHTSVQHLAYIFAVLDYVVVVAVTLSALRECNQSITEHELSDIDDLKMARLCHLACICKMWNTSFPYSENPFAILDAINTKTECQMPHSAEDCANYISELICQGVSGELMYSPLQNNILKDMIINDIDSTIHGTFKKKFLPLWLAGSSDHLYPMTSRIMEKLFFGSVCDLARIICDTVASRKDIRKWQIDHFDWQLRRAAHIIGVHIEPDGPASLAAMINTLMCGNVNSITSNLKHAYNRACRRVQLPLSISHDWSKTVSWTQLRDITLAFKDTLTALEQFQSAWQSKLNHLDDTRYIKYITVDDTGSNFPMLDMSEECSCLAKPTIFDIVCLDSVSQPICGTPASINDVRQPGGQLWMDSWNTISKIFLL